MPAPDALQHNLGVARVGQKARINARRRHGIAAGQTDLAARIGPQLADAAGEAIAKMHLAHMVLEYGDDEMQLKIGAIEAGI
jgi:hypothetical protein